MKRSTPASGSSGFTLVELLVVIAIIVILMGILLGAVPAVKEASRKLEAKNMANQIVVAVNAYYTEYSKFPPLIGKDDPDPDPSRDQWVGDVSLGASKENSSLFDTLRNIDRGTNEGNRGNPRRVVFMDAKVATVSSANKPRGGFYDRNSTGGTPDKAGSLFDPWGVQYGVILDTTGDDRIDMQGIYTDFTGAESNTGKAPRKKVGAFSAGRDNTLGTKNNHQYRDGSEASDDVITWE